MIIIATIGPASMNKKVIKDIINSGADILRLNFSHNSLSDFKIIMRYAKNIKKDINIMQDLCGSKIRVSNCLVDVFKVFNNETVTFCSETDFEKFKAKNVIPLNIKKRDIIDLKCQYITMKDDTMVFKILETQDGKAICKAVRGGVIRAGKGCNIKGYRREDIHITNKDKSDIDFAYKNSFDIISQSYVESPAEIINIKKYIEKYKGYNPKIFAKIETKKGIDNAYDIASVSDGIIIGRGDLVPETSIFDVPVYEDYVVEKIKKTGKSVIFATHVFDSMQRGYKLTLPEVEFVYSAIKMGGGGFLLAGETSVGKRPEKTVQVLKALINKYEGIYETR